MALYINYNIMRLTATSTSTSLQALIKAYDETNSTNVLEWLSARAGIWGFNVEIMRDDKDVYVETVLSEADSDSRPVDSTNNIFKFTTNSLDNVFVYGSWEFIISIF